MVAKASYAALNWETQHTELSTVNGPSPRCKYSPTPAEQTVHAQIFPRGPTHPFNAAGRLMSRSAAIWQSIRARTSGTSHSYRHCHHLDGPACHVALWRRSTSRRIFPTPEALSSNHLLF